MGYKPTLDMSSIKVYIGTIGAGSMTSGSPLLNVTSFPALPGHGSGNAFTAGDVGNWVQVIGGNGPGTNLLGTIITFTDANHVTLSVNAGATVGGSGFFNVIVFRKILIREGTLRVEESATARDTASFATQHSILYEGQPVLITSTDAAVGVETAGSFFGGRIASVEINNEPATGIRNCVAECVSWECLADDRVMLAKDYSATDSTVIATDILGNLREDFVGLTITGAAASVASFSVNAYGFLNAALDDLISQIGSPGVGYFWRAHPFRDFEFGLIGSSAAPWNIDDTAASDGNVLINIKLTRSLEKYANHAYVKADQVLGAPVTLSGKALVLSRIITYPDLVFGAIPKLVVNGVTQVVKEPDTNTIDPRSVGEWSSTFNYGVGVLVYMNPPPTGIAPTVYKSIQTPNVNHNPTTSPTFWTVVSITNPTGADWVWIKGTGYLWTDPSHPGILANQTYTLTYVTGADGPPSFNEYAAGVTQRSSIEGGLGFHETVVSVSLPISRDDLNARAVAESELYGVVPESIEVKTFRGGLRKYQTILVKLSDMGINATYVITDTTLDMSDEFYPIWEVKMVLGSLIGDWATALIGAFGGPVPAGGTPIDSGNVTVPPTLGMFLTSNAATINVAFAGSLQGTGGTFPYAYAIVSGALPTGLSLGAGDGAITGSPSVLGAFNFTASVTDVMGGVFTASFTITVSNPVALTPPALLSVTGVVNYIKIGNAFQFNIAVTIAMPTTDPLYGQIAWVNIFLSSANPVGGRWRGVIYSPIPLSGTNLVVNSDQFEMPLTSDAWSINCESFNADGVPSGSPALNSVTVTPSTISSVTIAEVGSRQQIPPGGNTYFNYTITPTFSNLNGVQALTSYRSFDGGSNFLWTNWEVFTPGSTGNFTESDFIRLGSSSSNFQVALVVGAIPGPSTANTLIPVGSLPAGAVLSNKITVQLGAPIATGATLAIAGPDGSSAPTQANIFMGVGANGPYAKVIFSIITPGASDAAPFFYDWWVIWVDSGGTPVNPGGPLNTSGYNHYWEIPNDGQTHVNDLLIDYPTNGDYYLQIMVWGRSRNSLVDTPPFGSDPAAVLQQWPGGLTYYRLHVGFPPGGGSQNIAGDTAYTTGANNNQAASMLSDPSFEACQPGIVVTSGAVTGPGFIPYWGLSFTSGSIEVKSTGGSSGPNFIRLTNASSSVYQSVDCQPGFTFYLQCQVRSNNPGGTHALGVQVNFYDSSHTLVSSAAIGSAVGFISAWAAGPSGYAVSPANASSVLVVLFNAAGETAGGYWEIDDIQFQPVINQTAGGQTGSTNPTTTSGDKSIIRAISNTTTAASVYGLGLMQILASDGSVITISCSAGGGFSIAATNASGSQLSLTGGSIIVKDNSGNSIINANNVGFGMFPPLNMADKITLYGNVATAGLGLAAVFGFANLTGQNAAIGATNLYGPGGNAPAGHYVVFAALISTTAGNAVTVSVRLDYSDPTTGAENITTANIALNAAHLKSSATYSFQHAGGAQITWQTTISGGAGTGVYSVRVILVRVA